MRFASSTFLTIALALAVSASPSSAKCMFDVPESDMGAAHILYTGDPGFRPAPVLAQNMLRVFVLLASDECVAEHREWLARTRWERDFKNLFNNVIRWKRETLAKGAAYIYRLSGAYRQRPDARENQFDDLSYNLLQLAAEMGHAAAKAELPNRLHPMDEPGVRARYWARKYSEAVKGDPLAQIYVAQEYLMGRVSRNNVARDPMKAYYWYLKAKPSAGEFLRHISDVPGQLSAAERKQVEEWVATGVVPAP